MSTALRIPRVVVCGAVDDGKSTLIGRLLVHTGSVPTDEIASITNADGDVDFARLTDGLALEREQGITIDVAYRYLALPGGHRVLLADSPGHEQYTRNMAVAASGADVALILIDVNVGIRDQTIRHATVCHLMGIRSYVIALNKIDQIADITERNARITAIRDEFERRVPQLFVEKHDSFHAPDAPAHSGSDVISTVQFAPISALHGINVAELDSTAGPADIVTRSLIDALGHGCDSIPTPDDNLATRLPIQYVVRIETERSYCGRLSGGSLSVGDTVNSWPSNATATVSRIFVGDREVTSARAGDAVAVSFHEEIDLGRGDILSRGSSVSTEDAPISRAHLVDLVWLDTDAMDPDRSYLLRVGPTSMPVHVSAIRYQYDLENGTHSRTSELGVNGVARAELTCNAPLLLEPYLNARDTGGFILCDRITGATVAAGMSVHTLRRQGNVTKHGFAVNRAKREEFNGIRSGVLWLTGLSGSGKSTIADLLESQLLEMGIRAFVLDGDSIRQTLSEDLGFSPEDRAENIRRVARVAQILMDAGIIALVALVSPFAKDRLAARELFADDDFAEVFVDTPLEVCEQRDPKGLYVQARASESTQMTGISQKYEAPEECEFHLDGTKSIEENAAILREWVLRRRF